MITAEDAPHGGIAITTAGVGDARTRLDGHGGHFTVIIGQDDVTPRLSVGQRHDRVYIAMPCHHRNGKALIATAAVEGSCHWRNRPEDIAHFASNRE